MIKNIKELFELIKSGGKYSSEHKIPTGKLSTTFMGAKGMVEGVDFDTVNKDELDSMYHNEELPIEGFILIQLNDEVNIENATKCAIPVVKMKWTDYVGQNFMIFDDMDIANYQILAYEGLTYGFIEKDFLQDLKTATDILFLKTILGDYYDKFCDKLNTAFEGKYIYTGRLGK